MERLKNLWRSLEKFLCRPFFFFLESTCACVLGPWPWPRAFLSLASRVSVIGKAVLGLGFFLRPWLRALCSRLHLCCAPKTKSTAQAQIKPEILSTLGPSPNLTRKARPDLQLWLKYMSYNVDQALFYSGAGNNGTFLFFNYIICLQNKLCSSN